jgi:6-pyruvoyltetrahydropterin/6-carboxytetrahydropterin synthase
MFVLRIEDHFEAAHFLAHYKGKCEALHGHTWKVQAAFSGGQPEAKSGLVVDFKILKDLLFQVLKKLDHTLLNKNQMLKGQNPSCENLARLIFLAVKKEAGRTLKKQIRLLQLTVWESPTSGVTYNE